MIIHEICVGCGKCCTGELTGKDRCPWLGKSGGCIIRDEGRNLVCLAYPYVIVNDYRMPKFRRVFLDTKCPHWKEFVDQFDKITEDIPASLAIEIREVI